MRKVMRKCLKDADKNKLTSIAFPAIGTGNLLMPREVASKIMYHEVERFAQSVDKPNITDVRFVVFDNMSFNVRLLYFTSEAVIYSFKNL